MTLSVREDILEMEAVAKKFEHEDKTLTKSEQLLDCDADHVETIDADGSYVPYCELTFQPWCQSLDGEYNFDRKPHLNDSDRYTDASTSQCGSVATFKEIVLDSERSNSFDSKKFRVKRRSPMKTMKTSCAGASRLSEHQGHERLQNLSWGKSFLSCAEPSNEMPSNLPVHNSPDRKPSRPSFKFKIRIKENSLPKSLVSRSFQIDPARDSREVSSVENGPKRLKVKRSFHSGG